MGGSGVDSATEAEAWALLLSVDGLGPAGFGGLLAAYGSGRSILEAAPRRGAARSFAAIVAAAQGRHRPDPKVGERIVALAASTSGPLAVLRRSGVRIVTLDDPAYPRRLRSIDLPPPVLLVTGEVAALSADRAVAVVGTRRATDRGRLVAARIAAALSRSAAVVVSGLAVGIDGAAHAAAVAENAPTVAVLGSGHGRLYPRAHARLAAAILDTGGAVISERFPDAAPSAGAFPQRNRLISGLADATIVVEAGTRSGALITADSALVQGRACFVVPGPVDEPRSAGCLELYRAFPGEVRLVTGIPELLVDLGFDAAASDRGAATGRSPSLSTLLVELGATAREVAEALVAGHGSIDELVVEIGHEPATILSAITLLEMRGLATSTYGRYRPAGRLAGLIPKEAGGRAPRWRWRHRPLEVDPAVAASDLSGLPERNGPC